MIIRLDQGPGREDELCILEFQGEITGEFDGNKLGSIKLNDDKTAVMLVGRHKLEGRLVELKSPFLVVEKTSDAGGSLLIQGVAKSKIIFKHRAVACVGSELI